jgi:hypothetical protein
MIKHKLSNKTKNATVAEPKLFHQLNKPWSVLDFVCKKPIARGIIHPPRDLFFSRRLAFLFQPSPSIVLLCARTLASKPTSAVLKP